MSFRILPPVNALKRQARHQGLTALCQQGSDVGAFAHMFWTMAMGLDYNDFVLKDLLNSCLDEPLPKCEMDSLKILDFWNNFRYCGNRSQLGKPSQQESSCSDHPVLPSTTGQVYDPLLTPTKKCKSRKKRVVQTVTSTSESVKTVPATPESAETVSVTSESAETVPVIPESAKSVLVTAGLAKNAVPPELAELAASTPEVVKQTLSSRQKWKKGKSCAAQSVPES